VRRIAAATLTDLRLQWRAGFVLAGVVVAIMMIAIVLPWLSDGAQPLLELSLPTFVLGNLTTTAFFFAAAMATLERQEGSLDAIAVSPLRLSEYLVAKASSLALLATVETLVIIAVLYRGELDWPLLVVTTALLSALYTLGGFAAVLRYRSITDFLMPAVAFLVFVQLPILDSLGVWTNAIFYLFPTQPYLILLRAVTRDVPLWQLVYGVAGGALSLALAYVWARRRYERFICGGRGGR
jgi:fluoroquinolone transport system permease protein